jgi:hypothetical protein
LGPAEELMFAWTSVTVTQTLLNGPLGVAQVAGSLIIVVTEPIPLPTFPDMLLQAATKRAATNRAQIVSTAWKSGRNETALRDSIVDFLQSRYLTGTREPRRIVVLISGGRETMKQEL